MNKYTQVHKETNIFQLQDLLWLFSEKEKRSYILN